MNKLKRIASAAFCIALALSFTACSSTPLEGESQDLIKPGSAARGAVLDERAPIAYGRYIETKMDVNGCGQVMAIEARGDQLYVAARDGDAGEARFFRMAGDAFEELYYTLSPGLNVDDISVRADGEMALVCSAAGSFDASVYTLTGDAFEQSFPFSGMGASLEWMEDGDYMVFDGALKTVDPKGKTLDELSSDAVCFALEGDMLYTVDSSDNDAVFLTSRRYPSGAELQKREISGTNRSHPVIAGDGAGGLYLAGSDGIDHINAGGSKEERLLDGGTMAFAGITSYIGRFCALTDGSIYMIVCDWERGSFSLYRYTWSEDAPVYAQVELTIASLFPFLSEGVIDYMREHPEVKVNNRSYLPGGLSGRIDFTSPDEMAQYRTEVEDAVRKLNTELLSGNAPDILILDGMPLNSLIQKGILDDMSAWAQGRLDDATLLSGPVEGFRQGDGTLPCLPLKFTVPVLWGDRAQVSNLKTLDDLALAAQNLQGGHLMNLYFEWDLLRTLYPIFAAAWAGDDGRVAFTKEQISEFFRQLKAIQDAIPAPDTSEGNNAKSDDLASGTAHMAMAELGRDALPAQFYSLLKAAGKTPTAVYMPAAEGMRAYVPLNIVGVGAASEHKDIAYELLDALLAEAAQPQAGQSDTLEYTIVASGTASQLESSFAATFDWPLARVGGKDIMLSPMDDQTMQDVRALIEGVDTPVLIDYSLMTMMTEAYAPYLRGAKSLESVVDAFYGNVKAYLQE